MITEDLQNLYQTYLGEVPEEIVEFTLIRFQQALFPADRNPKTDWRYTALPKKKTKPFFIWQHTSARKVFLFQKYTSVLKTRIVICKKI